MRVVPTGTCWCRRSRLNGTDELCVELQSISRSLTDVMHTNSSKQHSAAEFDTGFNTESVYSSPRQGRPLKDAAYRRSRNLTLSGNINDVRTQLKTYCFGVAWL